MTKAFTVLIILIITLFDIATLTFRGYETTISWMLYSESLRFPVIPFVFGFLMGHLFFPNIAPFRSKDK